jgi:hypothetical protein
MYMKEQILFGMAPRANPSEFWVQNQETSTQKGSHGEISV